MHFRQLERAFSPSTLWIEVSGIAKGYAADRAIEKLRIHAREGGFKVYGPNSERVGFRPDFSISERMPVL
jgi:thiamine biosynthesis lipoprotein ApbE